MRELSSAQELDSVVSEETAILYKHSTQCPISAAAHQQLDRFMERNPDAPLYLVDVNDSADLSSYVVEKTGIEHQSPQLILFRGGTPAWQASHTGITAEALEEQLRT